MNRGRRDRSGFFFFYGWRTITTREFGTGVKGACPRCRQDDARLEGLRRQPWFTFFFVPIFPLGSKERSHRFSQCRECRFQFDMPIEQLSRRAHGGGGSSDFSDTIRAYNDLRDHPADGQRLLTLLEMYESLDEPTEAEAAARHFPAALAAEPRCAEVLERMSETTRE